jgi:hypothetical protein
MGDQQVSDVETPADEAAADRSVTDDEISNLADSLEGAPATGGSVQRGLQEPRSSWRESWLLAGGLTIVMIVMTVANLAGVGPFNRSVELSGDELQQRARQSVVFVAEEVEAYRAEHGGLPESLQTIGLQDKGEFSFQPRPDGTYIVTADVGGSQAAFDSASDDVDSYAERYLDGPGREQS